MDFDTAQSSSHIVPIICGSDRAAVDLADKLLSKKILSKAIRPPTVPEGKCRVRMSISAEHTRPQIDELLQALRDG